MTLVRSPWTLLPAAITAAIAIAAVLPYDDDDPNVVRAAAAFDVTAAPAADPAPADASAQTTASDAPDTLQRYAAMRDDINPKPRLQLIDDWARKARPDDARELMARAMVDPDESVRERAQVLFDRSMSNP